MSNKRSETIFPDGIIARQPHANAPDFVKCSISIARESAIKWLQAQTGEWVNLDVKESRAGRWYCAVNDYKQEDAPGRSAPRKEAPRDDIPFYDDDIPF